MEHTNVRTHFKVVVTFYFSVVNQYYEAQVYDVFVIKGNAAVFKCQIPSFVSDHVDIISWQDTDGNKFNPANDYGKIM